MSNRAAQKETSSHEQADARPDRQTVEQAKEWVLCDHRGSLALESFHRRCEECGFLWKPEYSPTAREKAIDSLIHAVRQEQADARPARTLEPVNDAIRRIMAEGGTPFQIEQRLTRHFVERDALLSGGEK